ncbi:MAG: SemiSWEET transporter [Rhodospirillales bacterium]
MDGWTDIVGLAAGTLTTVSFLPQVIRTWRTRSTRDLSLPMWIIFTTGVALWLVYGLMMQAWPIIIANVITVGLAAVVLVLKFRHG